MVHVLSVRAERDGYHWLQMSGYAEKWDIKLANFSMKNENGSVSQKVEIWQNLWTLKNLNLNFKFIYLNYKFYSIKRKCLQQNSDKNCPYFVQFSVTLHIIYI